MNTKERRKDMRIPVLSEAVTVETTTWTEKLSYDNISKSGVFIKANNLPAPQSVVYLRFELPGDLGMLTMTGRVVRVKWNVDKKKSGDSKGFAVEFYEQTTHVKRIFDAFLTYIRNKQIIAVSKRIIEEFFGSGNRTI